VRALRVYEREGLVAPVRSDKGWRRYGPAEVARLNTVVSLKALGLTLGQIRQVLAASPPPLSQILDIQIEAWQARHAAAEQALRLLEAARSRLSAAEPTLEELCGLVRTLGLNAGDDMSNPGVLYRRLINESLSAEEERAWNTWWAGHPEDAAQSRRMVEMTRVLHAEVEQLTAGDADPASALAQGLVRRHLEIWTQCGSRERMIRLMQWNPAVAAKFYAIWPRASLLQQPIPWHTPLTPPATAFWGRALESSAATQDCRRLLEEIGRLLAAHTGPAAPEASSAVQRLEEICRTHGLGDAHVYVQWTRLTARLNPLGGSHEAAWAFLAAALESQDPQRAADTRGLSGWLEAASGAEAPGLAVRNVPVIPLRDVVLYPGILLPVFIQRPASLQAAEAALKGDRRALLVTQRLPDTGEPVREDLHTVGTCAQVLDMSAAVAGVVTVTVAGIARARVDAMCERGPLSADITLLADAPAAGTAELETLRTAVLARLEQVVRARGADPATVSSLLARLGGLGCGALADNVAAQAPLPLAQRQEVLEILDTRRRLTHVDRAIRALAPGGSG
jgi:Lon protease-like protein/DNA-binding transcriptional MerR regulator